MVIETDASYITINGEKIEFAVTPDLVSVRIYPSAGKYEHKIHFIKAMRTATGCELKEGKDIAESGTIHTFRCQRQIADYFLREMSNIKVVAEIVAE